MVVAGIITEDENGEMDLGALERKLVEKHHQSRQASQAVSQPTSPSLATSGPDGASSTSHSSITSPEPSKEKESDHYEKGRSMPPPPPEEKKQEEEVEALSEMMCSLVTNTSGETRYIGTLPVTRTPNSSVSLYRLTTQQVPPPDSPSFRPKAFSG